MLDFVSIKAIPTKNSVIIYPEFIVKKSKDLMIRGKAFYAVWDEVRGLWSRNEDDVQRIVDQEILQFAKKYGEGSCDLKLMKNFSSNKWTEWQKYCKSLPDNYHELDDQITFSNADVKKEDYVTRKLSYPMKDGKCPAYNEMMEFLYAPEEREKLEWAIGAVISGDSKWIQKFIVLYGGPGTGKSTVLNIIQDLFPGYVAVFESKALSSANNAFALESLRANPLIGIQHEGDLSKIEDNTKLNSIISHEEMIVNEKFKSTYSSRFHTFLFMGTNKPVRITDAKSGIIRRLIDVSPTGNRIPRKKYDELQHQIKFEYGEIANHCLQVYRELGPSYYDSYQPISMIGATNDFYNFIEEQYDFFTMDHPEGISLNTAWLRYKEYCSDANVPYPFSKRLFKEELKNYFSSFEERHGQERNFYSGFLKEKLDFRGREVKKDSEDQNEKWLMFNSTTSLLDEVLRDFPAQYTKEDETPKDAWIKVKTKLKDLDTKRLHYVQGPISLIVVDFDLKDKNGKKNFDKNLEEASKWPKTYAELSKSGSGIHLHYIYEGDAEKLKNIYKEDVEIKIFRGSSALRRKVTKCNDVPIATISSGLPQKEENNMLTEKVISSEKNLRKMIERNLRREIHPNTKPSIDFIYKILEDAYNSGIHYDVSDMLPTITHFAMTSSHQAGNCLKIVNKMKMKSEEPSDNVEKYNEEDSIIFVDTEVFPNLFVVCWKKHGSKLVNKMINPSPEDISNLVKMKLVGFNNRKYDNHLLYARMLGYTEQQLYQLSQTIITYKSGFFGEAYNLSYTDIYDFLSASNKMSLKKWEIKLGIHHQELGLRWDEEVPENLVKKVADYCCNDVNATEAVFDSESGQSDWLARKVLAEWAEMTVNDTTNNLSTKIIVGNDPKPQTKFIYTDLSTIYPGYKYNKFGIDEKEYNEGTKIVSGKSIYRGEDPGEGGYVYAKPGIYYEVALLDIASMHPSSIIRLKIFGEEYTLRFENIVRARIEIKHKNYEGAKKYLPERLHKYLNNADKAKELANALKTAINSVYGLTSAKFSNKLRDPRNVDNIVAKYGALFMINLKHEVEDRGYTVVHIKTDSIKIANATPEIIQFVMDYGKRYGFNFEHEDTYSKICLVNDAVYIAKYKKAHLDKNQNEIWWTATGTQFQVPYVFKTLFSGEAIEFSDLCETKSVTTAMYLDFDEKMDKLPFDENGIAIPEDDPRNHDYRFVGKVGSFCPIKEGCGGGILLRENDGKYHAVVGTKKKKGGVYRWMESEMVRNLGNYEDIDLEYYDHLVEEAIRSIEEYGNFKEFVSNEFTRK